MKETYMPKEEATNTEAYLKKLPAKLILRWIHRSTYGYLILASVEVCN